MSRKSDYYSYLTGNNIFEFYVLFVKGVRHVQKHKQQILFVFHVAVFSLLVYSIY